MISVFLPKYYIFCTKVYKKTFSIYLQPNTEKNVWLHNVKYKGSAFYCNDTKKIYKHCRLSFKRNRHLFHDLVTKVPLAGRLVTFLIYTPLTWTSHVWALCTTLVHISSECIEVSRIVPQQSLAGSYLT